MTTEAKNQIIALIPNLSTKEKAEVRKALDPFGTTKTDEPLPGEDWLLEGIEAFMRKEGLLTGSLIHLKRMHAYTQYSDKRPRVEAFLHEAVGASALRHARIRPRLAYLCAAALWAMLEAQNLRSPSFMLSQIDRLPAALDAAYPGYVGNRLLGFIVGAGI